MIYVSVVSNVYYKLKYRERESQGRPETVTSFFYPKAPGGCVDKM